MVSSFYHIRANASHWLIYHFYIYIYIYILLYLVYFCIYIIFCWNYVLRINIITVGKRPPQWVEVAFLEYAKRFSNDHPIQLFEVSSEKSSHLSISTKLEKEAQRIQSHIAKNSYTIALDVLGKSFSTEQLAQKFDLWQQNHSTLNFVIGGADGLSSNILQTSQEQWSLSPLTLPHHLVRIILIEQLYRAYSLLSNHPYHRS